MRLWGGGGGVGVVWMQGSGSDILHGTYLNRVILGPSPAASRAPKLK